MRYLSIGEPLVEFSARRDAPSVFDRRVGGDTLNIAIYLSRLAGSGQVGYLSCLGDDPYSLWLRESIAGEGIDVSGLATWAGAQPGLSFISTDARGERSFAYWRDQAPFRGYFDDPAHLAGLSAAPTLILSAVTLAVLHPEGRTNLLAGLAQRRQEGARVIFDTNYRPVLWPDAATARAAITQAAGLASLVMPSLDDMAGCFGTPDPDDAMRVLAGLTEAEIVLTTGGDSVLHRASGVARHDRHGLPAAVAAIDTSGAGDSFDAAYLAGRDAGLDPGAAIAAAARLAAIVVCHPGTIIPAEAMPVVARSPRVAT